MCENCVKHGGGGKWFLNAENYSLDLLADLRRRRYTLDFLAGNARLVGRADPMDRLRLLPRFLRPVVNAGIERSMAANHYGQVVTLAEVRAILSMVSSAVRLPCVCRRITLGEEQRHCFGLSLSPDSVGAAALVDPSYWEGPDGQGMERLTPSQALAAITELNRQGLVHTVWTFGTPFIAEICNCAPGDCRAVNAKVSHGLNVLHAGESVVSVSYEHCTGCGRCARRCHFGALQPGCPTHAAQTGSGARLRADVGRCLGCGLCVGSCPRGALSLVAR